MLEKQDIVNTHRKKTFPETAESKIKEIIITETTLGNTSPTKFSKKIPTLFPPFDKKKAAREEEIDKASKLKKFSQKYDDTVKELRSDKIIPSNEKVVENKKKNSLEEFDVILQKYKDKDLDEKVKNIEKELELRKQKLKSEKEPPTVKEHNEGLAYNIIKTQEVYDEKLLKQIENMELGRMRRAQVNKGYKYLEELKQKEARIAKVKEEKVLLSKANLFRVKEVLGGDWSLPNEKSGFGNQDPMKKFDEKVDIVTLEKKTNVSSIPVVKYCKEKQYSKSLWDKVQKEDGIKLKLR
ncbi:hypothetical protein ABK040_001255 [Willaertia magna]